MKDHSFSKLQTVIDSFKRPELQRKRKYRHWVVPIVWTQSVDCGLFKDKSLSITGLLVLTNNKAQWIGIVTPEFSKKLGVFLQEQGFFLAEDAVNLSIKSDVVVSNDLRPKKFEKFVEALNECKMKPQLGLLKNADVVDFYAQKSSEFNLDIPGDLGLSVTGLIRLSVERSLNDTSLRKARNIVEYSSAFLSRHHLNPTLYTRYKFRTFNNKGYI